MTAAAKASSTRARGKQNGAQANGQPEHNTLLDALWAVQSEAPTLPKDKTNPHFKSKYTPLDTMVEKIGPILSQHGLVWTTLPCRDEQGEPALRYRLAHVASGEELEGLMPLMLGKADSQGMGAAITYARRYSLAAVLNLVADEDDDGERTRQTGGEDTAERKLPAEKVAALEKILGESGIEQKHLDAKLRSFGAKQIADLTVEQGIALWEWIGGQAKGGE